MNQLADIVERHAATPRGVNGAQTFKRWLGRRGKTDAGKNALPQFLGQRAFFA
jgi:hypothetical protein